MARQLAAILVADVLGAPLQDGEVLLEEHLVALGGVLGQVGQVLVDVGPILGGGDAEAA